MKRNKIRIIVGCHLCGLQKEFKKMPSEMVMVKCRTLHCDTVYYAVPPTSANYHIKDIKTRTPKLRLLNKSSGG